MKDIRNDASHENARLLIENARLREVIERQQNAIYQIEEIALTSPQSVCEKNILDVISGLRGNKKGEINNGIYT